MLSLSFFYRVTVPFRGYAGGSGNAHTLQLWREQDVFSLLLPAPVAFEALPLPGMPVCVVGLRRIALVRSVRSVCNRNFLNRKYPAPRERPGASTDLERNESSHLSVRVIAAEVVLERTWRSKYVHVRLTPYPTLDAVW